MGLVAKIPASKVTKQREPQARRAGGDHSSGFAGFAGARGIDQGSCAPLHFRVRHGPGTPGLRVRKAARPHFLLAEVESVPQECR
ncbi:MAG: hypothetical protein ACT4P4_03585 [Betaproteobacteria bacterium]